MSCRNGPPLGDVNRVLLLLVGLLVAMPGCSSKPRLDYRLTVVVADSLGSETDNLPQDIRDLLLPIEDCELGFLVPNPTVYRLGYDRSTATRFDTSVDAGFAGNPNNARLVSRSIQKMLLSTPIGKTLAESGHSTEDLSAELDRYLESLDDRHLKLFYSSAGGVENTHDGDRVHDSVQAVRAEIGGKICGEDFLSAFVFVDPPLVRDADPHNGEKVLDAERLRDLATQNAEAGRHHDSEKLDKVAGELRALRGESTNWRVTYEFMKNRVYGKRHSEGFSLLKTAVDEALAAKEEEYLLDMIDGEKELKDEPLWKLWTHPEIFNPIVERLHHDPSDKH